MFKRLLWLLMGASFGLGASYWTTRWVRQTVERYAPDRLAADVAGAVRTAGGELRDAVAEGRIAMREREEELRRRFEPAPRPDRPVPRSG